MTKQEKFEEIKEWVKIYYKNIFNSQVKEHSNIDLSDTNFFNNIRFIEKHREYLDGYIDYLYENKSRLSIRTLKGIVKEEFFSVFLLNGLKDKNHLENIRKNLPHEIYFLEKYSEYFDCDLDVFFKNLNNYQNLIKENSSNKFNQVLSLLVTQMIEGYVSNFLKDEINEYFKNGYFDSALEDFVLNKDESFRSCSFNSKTIEKVYNTYCYLIEKITEEISKIEEDTKFKEKFIELWNTVINKEKYMLFVFSEEDIKRYISLCDKDELLSFMKDAKSNYPSNLLEKLKNIIMVIKPDDINQFKKNNLIEENSNIFKKQIMFPYQDRYLFIEKEKVFSFNNKVFYSTSRKIDEKSYMVINIISNYKLSISAEECIIFINEKTKDIEKKSMISTDIVDAYIDDLIGGLVLLSKIKDSDKKEIKETKKKI